MGLLWEFPGGKVEPGENHAQALQRELMEELGLAATIGPLYRQKTYAYPDRTVNLYFYHCRAPADARPQARDVRNFRWVEPAALADYAFPPANDELIADLVRYGG